MATRRERVILELEDNFTSGMARAAAAAALLDRNLDSLSGSAVDTRKSVLDLNRSSDGLPALGRNSEAAGRQIDRLSGRMALFAKLGATVGPSLVPIAAIGIPAVTGLAAQLGFAALAGGTAVVAFQGVGDTLKAMNKAHLEPTAENLEAARQAMKDLSPAAREFVVEARRMVPALKEIRDSAAEGMFPGLLDGMDAIEARLPDVERILRTVGEAVGEILGDTGESLASARWDDFFDFLATDATSALGELAQSVGSVTHGLAELWMAFDPLNDDFSSWLVRVTADFDSWAESLAGTNGFSEFVDYIQTTGPQVADALGAIGNAVVQIVEAIAPLGGVSLKGLEIFGDVVAKIADSDIGTPIFAALAAMSALSLATSAWGAVGATAAGRFVAGQVLAQNAIGQTYVKMSGLGKSAALLAGLTLATSDMADGFELSNAASGALIGTMGGPWGVAIGAATGFALDFAAAGDAMEASIVRVNQAFESGTIAEQRQALKDLKATTDEASAGFLDLLDPIDLLSDPIDAAKSSFNLLSGATGEAREEYDHLRDSLGGTDIGHLLAGPLGLAADAFLNADAAMQQFETSFRRINDLLTRSSTLIAYEQALDDLTKSIKENGDTWDRSTNKGRENLLARNKLVEMAIERSKALREEGDKLGAQRILQRALKDLKAFGDDSPKAKAAVADLIAELERLDKKHAKPEIDADNKPAKKRIAEADSWLLDYSKKRPVAHVDADTSNAWAKFFDIDRWQPKDKFMTVHVGVSGGASVGINASADGSTVPKTGKGYADRHLYLLADGEEVISNRHGQADRWRPLLKDINANRLAVGGTTGATSSGPRIQQVPSLAAFKGLTEAMLWLERHVNGAGQQFEHLAHEIDRELRQRERLLEKELAHADKKMQRELDDLNELKAARRSLIESTADNFMTDLFGSVDVRSAFESGALGSAFGQNLLAWAQEQNGGAGVTNVADYLDAYLASLTPEQLAAVQGQAITGTIRQDTADAQQFQAVLAQLQGLGFDGAAFQELAVSGDLAQAQWLAQQSAEFIDQFEQAYAQRNAAAMDVGQQAAVDMRDEMRVQTRQFRAAREDFREVKHSLHRLEDRMHHLERLAEKSPRETGREVGHAINGSAAKAARSA